jgi:hypothetical protein
MQNRQNKDDNKTEKAKKPRVSQYLLHQIFLLLEYILGEKRTRCNNKERTY